MKSRISKTNPLGGRVGDWNPQVGHSTMQLADIVHNMISLVSLKSMHVSLILSNL